MNYNFDLIVIGSGPGGQKSAVQAAKLGKKVALIEEYSAVGGGCVYFGTLPSKSFRESVYRWASRSQGTLGLELSLDGASSGSTSSSDSNERPSMQRLLKRKERVVKNEAKIVFDQLNRNGVKIFHGRGRLTDKNTVEIVSLQADKKNEKITAEIIILATGSRSSHPAHILIDGKKVLDSNTILDLKEVPSSMIVIGGGIIGAEYASMFSMAHTKVYLVDIRPQILSSVDQEIVSCLTERFESQGMELVLNVEVKKIISPKDLSQPVQVELSNGRTLEADVALISLGRAGNTVGLGLEEVGVDVDERGHIKVNAGYQTSVPNIYAVGDVIGRPALASTSMEQGRLACCHAFAIEGGYCANPFQLFPFGIYTIPEIAYIGQTEEELKEKKTPYVSGVARFKELARGQIVGDRWGMLKMLVDPKSGKLLGVHIVGHGAANLIHVGQAVMLLGGDVHYFVQNVFNYPTFAEAYKTAALAASNKLSS